ncbi:MAG: hypothetical protein WAU78_06930 [Roseiarcus sp.]
MAATVLGAVVAGVVVKLLPLDEFAKAFSPILRIFFAASIVVFAWQAQRYYGILSGAADPRGSRERGAYESLRQDLAEGGTPAKVYAQWLTWGLGKVDAFFGDAGRNDRSWFARKFGMETPGPRWTAAAFDRCLLLALIYPFLTIYAVWIWSGRVGVAEQALFLPASSGGYSGLWRALLGLAWVVEAYAFLRSVRAERPAAALLWGAFAFAGVVAFAFAGAFAGAVAFAGVLAFAGVVAFAGAFAFAGVFAVAAAVAFAFAVAGAFAVVVAGVVPGVVAGAIAGAFAFVAAVSILSRWSIRTRRQGLFLSLFIATLSLVIFGADYFLSTSRTWSRVGVVLKMFGLLTLVNAPFDWIAVGLTRALLRRGLAPGGRGPYFYALIDVIVAVPLIVLLALVTVVAVQTFDDIAVLRAGTDALILPLGPLFEGLENRPGDTEFWWVWFMLFSTLIPSLINLVIGAAAFLRGLPSLHAWILNRMPEGKAVRDNDRLPVACALAGQLAGGLLISGVLLYLLAAYVVPIGIPTLGATIRDFSEEVAAFNAPARLMMLLHGSP